MQWPVLPETSGAVTAYVANFKRPQNIAPIVHALLASPSIGRVIVSNNNPACNLRRWFHSPSDRVTIIEHSVRQSCAMRYLHLRQFPSPFYFVIDDDLLLLPSQIEQVLAELQNSPSVPHGIYGQRWANNHFHGGHQEQDGPLDVISRVYAFTHDHLAEWHRLFSLLPTDNMHLGYSDDLVLSRSGSTFPHMHAVGSFVDCPSQGVRDIAMWRQDGFHVGREDLYRQLQQIKPFPL